MSNQTLSRKALEKLGLSTEHLIGIFLTRNGELSREEENVFWSAFDYKIKYDTNNEKATLQYVRDLLILLMDILDENKTIRFPIQSLINSVSYAQFYLPLKTDSNLDKVLKRWNNNKAKYSLSCPASDELMRVLCKRFLEKEDAIDTLVVQCSTLHTLDEFNLLSDDMAYPTLLEEDNKNSGERCFVYGYLRNWIVGNKQRQFILLETLLLKMRTLSQQLKISPKMSETALLASVHIIRQLLEANPVTDATFLANSFAILEQYFLWPRPYGTQTHELLKAWRNELVAPGHNMRLRFFEDTRMMSLNIHNNRTCPIFYLFDASDHVSAGWSAQMQLSLWSNLCTSKYRYISDNLGGATRGQSFMSKAGKIEILPSAEDLLAMKPRDLPVPVMANLILNMLANDKLLKENTVQVIRKLTSTSIATFFTTFHQTMLSILNQKIETAQAVRIVALTSLRQELEDAAENPVYSCEPSDWYNPDDSSVFEATEEFVPATLPVSHIALPEGISFNMPEQNQIEDLNMTPFPHTPLYDSLIELFELHTAGATLASPSQIILAVCGGPHVLHSLVCAYLSVLSFRNDLCKLVKPKFLLLPFVSNPIANYIARHDAWYNRHILTPFRSEIFILPKTQPIFPANFAADKLLSRPGMFYRSLIEQYARESNSTLNLTVFKVAAWYENPANSQSKRYVSLPEHLIPLLQRLEIGFTIIPANKIAPSLRVQISRVDMRGNSLGTILEDSLSYQHVILSHVPVVRDVAFPANPAATFLEYYGYLSEASKGKSKIRESRSHVNQVEIVSSDPSQLFNVVIDGNQFGPYYKLIISPHYEDGQIVKFPISTFFPLPDAN